MKVADGQGNWVRACRATELAEDSPVHVDIGKYPMCLVRRRGSVYAFRDECTHESVPLSEGEIVGDAIECWLHGSRFDLATGRALSPPATRPVAVFPTRSEHGDVLVCIAPSQMTG